MPDWRFPRLLGPTRVRSLLFLAALNVVVPDVIVARFNIDRAVRAAARPATAPDLRHLSGLGGEAAGLATRATLAAPANGGEASDRQRCSAAQALLRRWGPTSAGALRRETDGGWRYWNAGEARALTDVGAHSAELRAVQHSACAAVPRAARGQ